MNYKIINGQLLIPADCGFKIEKQDLYIIGNKIAGTGTCSELETESYETIDAAGHLIMPGLINLHTHVYMTFMRNYADDVDFDEWLFKRVMPVEDKLSKEAAYWSSLLGCIEMIQTGTTSFVDMHMFHKQSPKAASQAGMRAFIGRGLVGDDLYGDGGSRFQEALEEKDAYESELIQFILSPHAIYSCSEKLLAQIAEEAARRKMLKQIHLSESITEVKNAVAKYGKTPAEYLSDIGFLDNHTILAHCVQMTENDIEIIHRHEANVVTNPASNAKLGNGFAPVTEMHNSGINICIGTDGTASNNTLNMFREMGLLSLIHKGIKQDSTSAPAQFVIKAATENGAKALGMEHKIGVIKEGAYADLIFIDLHAVSLFPNNNVLSSLCYSANGSEVDSVMIGGKFVMRNREMLTIDTERVYYEVNRLAGRFL